MFNKWETSKLPDGFHKFDTSPVVSLYLQYLTLNISAAALPLSYRSSAGLRVTLGVGRRRASLQVVLAVLELTQRVPAFSAVKTLHT